MTIDTTSRNRNHVSIGGNVSHGTGNTQEGEVVAAAFPVLPFAPRSQKRAFFRDLSFAPLLPDTLEEHDEDPVQDCRSNTKRIKLSPRFKTSSHVVRRKITGNDGSSYFSSENYEIWISDDDDDADEDDSEEEEEKDEEAPSACTGNSSRSKRVGWCQSSRGRDLDNTIVPCKSWSSSMVGRAQSSSAVGLKPSRRNSLAAHTA